MSEDKVGHYAILVAGQPPGWDMTALGLALYDEDGGLVWSKFEPLQKAIDRGDWPETAFTNIPHHLPETWYDMVATFERIGNAMACLSWFEGGVTLQPDEVTGRRLYETIVQRKSNE